MTATELKNHPDFLAHCTTCEKDGLERLIRFDPDMDMYQVEIV